MISSVLPSSHPGSLTSQSNHSFKTARKRANHHLTNTKRIPSNRHRSKSFNTHNDDLTDDMDLLNEDDINNNHDEQQNQSIDDVQSSPENIEEIVRDTVDRLVAITLLNNAPFIVNMITGTPGNGANTNTESKSLANTNVSLSEIKIDFPALFFSRLHLLQNPFQLIIIVMILHYSHQLQVNYEIPCSKHHLFDNNNNLLFNQLHPQINQLIQ
jgi:hypothetical protein